MSEHYGQTLHLELFGESHAASIGMRLSGFPAGVSIDMEELQAFLSRRAPGKNIWATGRREPDIPFFQRGISDGKTDGSQITAVIYNRDFQPSQYDTAIPRPGHADYAVYCKYGAAAVKTGGGAHSGRMTAALCIAGGLCLQYLKRLGIEIGAHAAAIAGITDDRFDPIQPRLRALQGKEFPVLSDQQGARMQEAIIKARDEMDSVGGVVECAATGLPSGLGEHPFDGMENRISAIVFAIPAVKGIDFGSGFAGTIMRGSENNDGYGISDGKIQILGNNHGGILGGTTTGMPLIFRVAVKPTPSIGLLQSSVNLTTGQAEKLMIKGRHDPCIVPRAVPAVEAATAIALCDVLLTEKRSMPDGAK